ncbi:hypothetical protein [Thalassospira sp. MCCC 1A01428]|uniref:hypothetical protein n=1 Tax=Thalassospira sp. MCCC 1A01428 TaxID=1470575 RepID=UPI00143D3DB5|nr:hypothetical protein [Thalassospira sp. MCCC 1A01428]
MPCPIARLSRILIVLVVAAPILAGCSGIDWQASIRQSLSNACEASRHCGSNGIPQAD